MHSQAQKVTAEYDKIPSMPRSHHKPWPGRKVTKVDEVINYKSTFPCNLHPLRKGDDVQRKAHKVGGLDCSSVEKWTYFEKHVANRKGGDSSSSSNSSSSPPFSTSISSSRSVTSIDSPLSQRKQSPTLVACQNPYSRTLHTKASIRHNHEHDKINKSDIKGISHDSSQHLDSGSLPCTPKINDRPAFLQKNVKMEFQQSCEQGFPGNVHLVKTDLPDLRSLIESTRDCLDENDNASSISVDSSTNRRSTEVNKNNMAEIFPPNVINLPLPSPQISYSCPLPVSEKEVPIAGRKQDHLKLSRINHGLSEKVTSQAEVKVAARPKRDLSPQRLLRAGLNRIKSSSLSGQQIKQTICSDNSYNESSTSDRKAPRSLSPQRLLSASLNLLRNSTVREGLSETDNSLEDTAATNIRGRRSPLRRIFDPLKSKAEVHFSGQITSLPSHQAQGESTRDKLPIHDELKSSTTRQALVKLAWKNGLPLFVFSSCDANILVATIGKGAASQNSMHEWKYTIFTDNVELKKNYKVWTSPIKKNKKHDIADNTVISQMRISSSNSTTEFVLYGGEQTSTTNEHFSSLFRNEVAAIVIQNQSRIELKNEKLAMVAILPSGVHGISTAGKPSPLIERWKSGGSCDCGGWDEGCMLTVLSDKNQETSSSLDGASTADETRRIELFTQGETEENKHAFSMTTFKEGVYTVDFLASISSLQAFAICIAILHTRKHITLSGLHYSVEGRSFEEQTIVGHASAGSASYEYHPPLSPIGRA